MSGDRPYTLWTRLHPGWEKTRPRGEAHGSAKLTARKVLAIRLDYAKHKTAMRKLVAKYGVHNTLIFFIIHRKIWTHV